MDLNDIRVFTKVVQAGSFTAAARLLRMPKSSVSRRVSVLEEQLGARLLQRTTRKLGLTEAGRVYFERTARWVTELEAADEALEGQRARPHGRLRVTAPLSFGMLGATVAAFLTEHPEVEVELVCTDRVVDLVEEGFDLAVRAGRLSDSALVAKKLGTLRGILVASPALLARTGVPRAPEALRTFPCLAFGSSPSPNRWTLHRGDEVNTVAFSPRLTANTFDVLLDAARHGLGVALVPETLCADALAHGGLRQILGAWASAQTPVHALYPSSRQLSPKVNAFLDALAQNPPGGTKGRKAPRRATRG